MENKDYVFHIKWNSYRVGTLAWIDKNFYLLQRDKENIKGAYNEGFKGIHSFDPEIEVYQSDELFEFFERRTAAKEPIEQCKDFASKRGVSTVDSFSLDEVYLSEKAIELFKKELLKKLAKCEKIKGKLKKKETVEKKHKIENDTNDSPNI